VKWRLPDDWDPGEALPRPRTAAEVGEVLGIDDRMVHALDWILVDHGRSYWREVDSTLHREISVPIDVAQRWWDGEWGGIAHEDGRRKSSEEILSAPRQKVPPKPVPHTIDDPAEMLRHLIEDHGLTRLRRDDPGYGYEYDHRPAHEYEAQDQEWDRTLRASDGPASTHVLDQLESGIGSSYEQRMAQLYGGSERAAKRHQIHEEAKEARRLLFDEFPDPRIRRSEMTRAQIQALEALIARDEALLNESPSSEVCRQILDQYAPVRLEAGATDDHDLFYAWYATALAEAREARLAKDREMRAGG
jgi:hypothetical protein